jgi:Carboxypeptidase regulatory-like domain/Neocarzinostatin family
MRSGVRVPCAVLVACGGAMVGAPSAAQEAPPTLTVTPATDLADGDTVQVTGSGFEPSSLGGFCQAVVDGPLDIGDCSGPIEIVRIDEAGQFSGSFEVSRFMGPSNTGVATDCAQPEAACVIGAESQDGGQAAVAPLTFTPQPPWSYTMTVTPDADLVGGDVVEVQGSGFPPSIEVDICQGIPDECAWPTTDWRRVQVDESGAFSASYTVKRVLDTFSGLSYDCAAPSSSCTLLVEWNRSAVLAAVPLAFAPQPVTQMSGTVTDPDGTPRAGVEVWAYAPTDPFAGSVRSVTDAQGSYVLDGVDPAEEYRVLFRAPAHSSLASEWFDDASSRATARAIVGRDGPSLDLDAQLDPEGSLSGRVTGPSGGPVPGVVVRAYQPGDRYVPSYVGTTASDGRYRLAGLHSADLRVGFIAPAGSGLATEWYDDVATRARATEVTVGGGQGVINIDAQLAAATAPASAVTAVTAE